MENNLNVLNTEQQNSSSQMPKVPSPSPQMSYPAPENPLKCKIESKLKLSLLTLSTIAISLVLNIVFLNLSYINEEIIYDIGLAGVLSSVITLCFNFFIGRYIYESNLGAAVFTGLLSLSGSFSSYIASAIANLLFLFTNEISKSSHLQSALSTVTEIILSISFVLLFNALTENPKDDEGKNSERFPKNPAVYMIILYIAGGFVSYIPTFILSALNTIFMFEASDSTMNLQAINSFMPVLIIFTVFLQTVIYYFVIKRAYLTKVRTLALIGLIYFSNVVSNPFAQLFTTVKYLLDTFTSIDETILTMLFASGFTFVTFIMNLVFIALMTKKFEPEIRKI